jgi:hypothetical protein
MGICPKERYWCTDQDHGRDDGVSRKLTRSTVHACTSTAILAPVHRISKEILASVLPYHNWFTGADQDLKSQISDKILWGSHRSSKDNLMGILPVPWRDTGAPTKIMRILTHNRDPSRSILP